MEIMFDSLRRLDHIIQSSPHFRASRSAKRLFHYIFPCDFGLQSLKRGKLELYSGQRLTLVTPLRVWNVVWQKLHMAITNWPEDISDHITENLIPCTYYMDTIYPPYNKIYFRIFLSPSDTPNHVTFPRHYLMRIYVKAIVRVLDFLKIFFGAL